MKVFIYMNMEDIVMVLYIDMKVLFYEGMILKKYDLLYMMKVNFC